MDQSGSILAHLAQVMKTSVGGFSPALLPDKSTDGRMRDEEQLSSEVDVKSLLCF